MTTIGMLIFDDAEELDFVGPWEVFTMAAKIRDDIRVVTIAERTKSPRLVCAARNGGSGRCATSSSLLDNRRANSRSRGKA